MEKKDVKIKVDEYFGSVPHNVRIDSVGKMIYLDVNYEDFKPVSEVRTELESLIPFCCCDNIDRRYSASVIMRELEDISNKDIDILVKESSGTYRQVPLSVYIEENLFYRELA